MSKKPNNNDVLDIGGLSITDEDLKKVINQPMTDEQCNKVVPFLEDMLEYSVEKGGNPYVADMIGKLLDVASKGASEMNAMKDNASSGLTAHEWAASQPSSSRLESKLKSKYVKEVVGIGQPREAAQEGLSCWVCLEEGPDNDGNPLVRDCSCRGTMGFAHIICMNNYAEQKSKVVRDLNERVEGDLHGCNVFRNPWRACPNCHQAYQNQLAIDMAIRFMSFVERTYPKNAWRKLEAMFLRMKANDVVATSSFLGPDEETIQMAHKIITMVGQMKAIEMIRALSPSSNSILPYRIRQIEASAHHQLGRNGLSARSKEKANDAIKHFKKARDLSEEINYTAGVTAANASIDRARRLLGLEPNKDWLSTQSEAYKQMAESTTEGTSSFASIENGIQLALSLSIENHQIESERLLSQLLDSCSRVHGCNHDLTKKLDHLLNSSRERMVKDGSGSLCEVLRYEEEGRKCVVLGQDQKETSIESKHVIIRLGTPVVCCGLKTARELNGKIGDVRSYDNGSGRYKVVFEDDSLKPCMVKQDNIRIVFELPDKV